MCGREGPVWGASSIEKPVGVPFDVLQTGQDIENLRHILEEGQRQLVRLRR